MNAIDTNVLVYSFDTDDPVRQQQAIELIDRLSEYSEETVLPWQVIVECLACLRRWVDRGRLSASDVDQHMADVSILFPVAMPSMNMIPISGHHPGPVVADLDSAGDRNKRLAGVGVKLRPTLSPRGRRLPGRAARTTATSARRKCDGGLTLQTCSYDHVAILHSF